MSFVIPALALTVALLGCAGHEAHGGAGKGEAAKAKSVARSHEHLKAAVADAGRPEADRKRDADRKPVKVLAFFEVGPGAQVGEFMAGSGYYTEILAKAVGPKGKVYAQNTKQVIDMFAGKPLGERFDRLGMDNIVRLDRDVEDPGFPKGLDVVLLIRFYHDFWWMEADRDAVNRAAFEALEPGGVYGVVDHHAPAGSGAEHVTKLHRIDAELLKKEVLAAGFVLDGESDVLADPDDTRDWYIFVDDGAKRDKTDRFVYRFRKPS